MQHKDSCTTDAHVRLSLRLRRALGLVGVSVASLGSGPCGGCLDEETLCFTLRDLKAARAQYIAGCTSGVAGQAGASPLASGSNPAAGAPGAAGAAGTSPGLPACDDWSLETIRAWDPDTGCPEWTPMYEINDAHFRSTGKELPPAAANETEPVCCQSSPPHCPGGRPFVVDGQARLPQLVAEPIAADASALSAALAQSWAQDGLAEYASIASFARLTLQLMAFGAPARLIEASQQASLDEQRHARLCFAESARHSGRRVEPGSLDIGRACDSLDFESFMLLNLVEGCVGETLAALHVAEQARLAASPALARTLTEISEDETRHAELAFEILRFGLTVDRPATLAALRRVLEMRFEDRVAACDDGVSDATWEAHGRLSAQTRRRIHKEGWNLVLAPLLQGLLLEESRRPPVSEQELARA